MEQMTLIAMRVSGQFEGDDPWANITGNFDDEGLTCGMLGKTFADGDQQQTVHRFLESFGESELLKLMPRTGADYLRLCALSKDQGTALISRWSVKGNSANVLEPYLSELRALLEITSHDLHSVQSGSGKTKGNLPLKTRRHGGSPAP